MDTCDLERAGLESQILLRIAEAVEQLRAGSKPAHRDLVEALMDYRYHGFSMSHAIKCGYHQNGTAAGSLFERARAELIAESLNFLFDHNRVSTVEHNK